MEKVVLILHVLQTPTIVDSSAYTQAQKINVNHGNTLMDKVVSIKKVLALLALNGMVKRVLQKILFVQMAFMDIIIIVSLCPKNVSLQLLGQEISASQKLTHAHMELISEMEIVFPICLARIIKFGIMR